MNCGFDKISIGLKHAQIPYGFGGEYLTVNVIEMKFGVTPSRFEVDNFLLTNKVHFIHTRNHQQIKRVTPKIKLWES